MHLINFVSRRCHFLLLGLAVLQLDLGSHYLVIRFLELCSEQEAFLLLHVVLLGLGRLDG